MFKLMPIGLEQKKSFDFLVLRLQKLKKVFVLRCNIHLLVGHIIGQILQFLEYFQILFLLHTSQTLFVSFFPDLVMQCAVFINFITTFLFLSF
ncbi:hypothetical protein JHK82_021572 [Glycine max]|nr:hypothetical protein JHK85_022028 [Glycine max]KAG5136841.1 hypothetical protein JHK82_021572 [Glycine max]